VIADETLREINANCPELREVIQLRIRAFVVSSNIQKALSMQVPVLVDDILA
jgi:hypothetical protein